MVIATARDTDCCVLMLQQVDVSVSECRLRCVDGKSVDYAAADWGRVGESLGYWRNVPADSGLVNNIFC